MMPATIQVTAFSGVLKKIQAQYVKVRDGFGGAWNNPNAATVSVNDYLSIANKDCLIIDAGNTVTLKFTPDAAGSDGQGFAKLATLKPYSMKVTEVSGTVYVIRARLITLTDLAPTIYGLTGRVAAAVGDVLEFGDYLLAAKSLSYFKIEIACGALPGVFSPPRLWEMPGLEEGINFANAF